jgi:4-hydroxyphenylpyruvate dioxygenase
MPIPRPVVSQKSLIPQNLLPHSSNQDVALEDFDCIEIWCESAKQLTFMLSHGFGFRPVAYKGPETGCRDSVSYVLQQGSVFLVCTSYLHSSSPIAHFVLTHGMAVRDVAYRVPDCEAAYYAAIARGALSAETPTIWSDENGSVKRAAIHTYGDTIHSFVERSSYKGSFWPGFVAFSDVFPNVKDVAEAGIRGIDHVVGNVELGKMEEWVHFYEKVLGFSQLTHFTDSDISTEYSALMSKVMWGGQGKIRMPINEPAHGRRKSQIEEYLDYNGGPGVQHIAFQTDDILGCVERLRERGVRFLRVPATYYDKVPERVGSIKENLKQIASLGILIDRDDGGYLLQIFTKTLHDRPTLFFEIIQREGSKGFGKGNFKALFEAIEREQHARGNL